MLGNIHLVSAHHDVDFDGELEYYRGHNYMVVQTYNPFTTNSILQFMTIVDNNSVFQTSRPDNDMDKWEMESVFDLFDSTNEQGE